MHPITIAAKGLLPVIFKIIEKCDLQAWSLLSPHAGKVIEFEIEHCAPIFLTIIDEKLRTCGSCDTPDVLIKGSLPDFLGLLFDAKFSTQKIHISGDIECAKALFETLNHIDLDWESQLANIIGHPLASTIATGFRQSVQYKKAFIARRKDDFENFLMNESHILPHPSEVEHFIEAVDTLKHDVERLEARILAFEAQL